jgi:cell division protein FtsX
MMMMIITHSTACLFITNTINVAKTKNGINDSVRVE